MRGHVRSCHVSHFHKFTPTIITPKYTHKKNSTQRRKTIDVYVGSVCVKQILVMREIGYLRGWMRVLRMPFVCVLCACRCDAYAKSKLTFDAADSPQRQLFLM